MNAVAETEVLRLRAIAVDVGRIVKASPSAHVGSERDSRLPEGVPPLSCVRRYGAIHRNSVTVLVQSVKLWEEPPQAATVEWIPLKEKSVQLSLTDRSYLVTICTIGERLRTAEVEKLLPINDIRGYP